MKKVEIIKQNEMIYEIRIDGKTHSYTGTLYSAEKEKRNLDFVLNTEIFQEMYNKAGV